MEATTFITLLLIGLGAIVVGFGRIILDRLPQPKPQARREACDYYVAFKIETVTEEDFEAVAFSDTVGRAFSVFGPTVNREWAEDLKPPNITRVGLKILPIPNWFEEARIGGIRFYETGAVEGSVRLPFQIAHVLLKDVRRNPDQLVVIGCKAGPNENGKRVDAVYSFEMIEPLR